MVTDLFVYPIGCNGKIQILPIKSKNKDEVA